ncbi:RNA polymerase Rpb7 N-terminal domain-containing protein [Forsythia ovata]|uniref:DNA-directed RNA polymerase subunit n=1 Tax=Forsythia ovata TaxID=205694 RepID=A0ABD1W2Q8_9LAMI
MRVSSSSSSSKDIARPPPSSLLKTLFVMSEIEHTLRLPPHLLNRPLNAAIKGELESLFLDKVIDKLGLCVSVYDILSIDGGFIFPGDGASTYTARFRLAMFRPYVGEVISARLKESTKDGLRLSLGFFDDIYVPIPLMPNPYHSEPDPEHKNGIRWVWEYMGENYPIDWMDEIRFRVHSVNYPPIPVEQGNDSEKKDSEEKDSRQKDLKPFVPMVIVGSLDADGLGPIAWWV